MPLAIFLTATKKGAKICFQSLFPLVKAECLLDLAVINKSFHKIKTISYWIEQLNVLAFYLMFMLTAARVPFFIFLQPLRSFDFGPTGYQFSMIASFAFIEMIGCRLWFYFAERKHPSLEQIEFIELLRQLNQQSHDRILKWTKVISLQYTCNGAVFGIFLIGIEILSSKDIWHFTIGLIHLAIYFHAIRIAPSDVLILYVYAFAGQKVIMDQMVELRRLVAQYGQLRCPMVAIVKQYLRLVKSIQRLNSVCTFLMLMSKSLVIPMGSMVFIISATPSSGSVSFIFKFIILLVTIFHIAHGYFLIALLSRVDTMSKRLYSEVNSVIVRAKCHSWNEILQLKSILEDLSSVKNHLAVRELNGQVTQMDTFDSAMLTQTILTQMFSLRGLSVY